MVANLHFPPTSCPCKGTCPSRPIGWVGTACLSGGAQKAETCYDFISRRELTLRRLRRRFLSCSMRMSIRYGLFTFVFMPPTNVRAKKLLSNAVQRENIFHCSLRTATHRGGQHVQ